MKRVSAFLSLVVILSFLAWPAHAQGEAAAIRAVDRNGAEISSLTDGNTIQLSIKLAAVSADGVEVEFALDQETAAVARCSVAAGTDKCSSAAFAALGWYWGTDGSAHSTRVVHARLAGRDAAGELALTIRPRPVVMVHGFLSSWETWKAYLGPSGYLAGIGLQGFAVGDGQEPGVLNTGSASDPAAKTNSIEQNAEILGGYIAGVQKQTGAEKVDLLVHSMGGMISRFYLDRVMKNDNVAQVIFLGSPMAGSACTAPLAALGYLTPASQEILPAYMINIFNQQILRRHGVPFHMVAGTLLVEPLTSPCAEAPSDTVVALGSATWVTMDDVQERPMYHGDFTSSRDVFEQNVLHLLKLPPGSFAPRPDLSAGSVDSQPQQFSRVYGGHLNPGESREVTINIDPNVTLANFSLYDSSRSLEVEVRGASGNVIQLDVTKNGVLKISDPAVMLYLGYGFKNPKPGKWVITLKTNQDTPPRGADYAMTARFNGGAALAAKSSATILAFGEGVTLSADLQADGASIQVDSANAVVRGPDGKQETLTLALRNGSYSVEYRPRQAGLYSAEVALTGKNKDGFAIDRAAFLAFEVQPESTQVQLVRIVAAVLCCGFILILLVLIWVWRRRRKV